MKLQCKTKLAQRTYTESKLVGDQGTGIHIVLIDADTNQIITTGIESFIKVYVVVLEGDFNREDHENWSREEFDNYIVKERQQKRPLLIGDLQVTLKEGVGSLNNLTFTDNSSWVRSKMFRIGVQVASGYYEGTRIREALTEPFSVLEHRGECKFYLLLSSWEHTAILLSGSHKVELTFGCFGQDCQMLWWNFTNKFLLYNDLIICSLAGDHTLELDSLLN